MSDDAALADAALVSETRGVLDDPLAHYIGKRSADKLAKIGLHTVRDVLLHVPFRLAQRGELMPIEAVHEGEAVTVVARVLTAQLRPMRARRGFILSLTVTDGEHDLALTFFSKNPRPLQFHEKQLQPGTIATFSGTISSYRGQLQLTHPEYNLLESENAVDSAALARPIPIYHASASAPSWKIEQAVALILPRITEADMPDPLPHAFRAAHDLPGKLAAVRALHMPADVEQWQQARRRMAYEEAFVLQTVLARRRAQASAQAARVVLTSAADSATSATTESAASAATGATTAPAPAGVAAAFEARLPFALTSGQQAVGKEIAADLAREIPMRRLLQGDVGTGKTIVALRAMLQIIDAGGQAVLLAPTEVLAQQHYATFQALLGDLSHGGEIGAPAAAIGLELLTGAPGARRKRETLARIASGAAQLIVGTHALLYDSVQIPFLGLVVVDEQHRFGVNQRDRLAQGVHLLVMTATPIPRTIAMTSFGDLDVSTLRTLPRGRAPIRTVLVPMQNDTWMHRVWERAREEVERGGRVYVVCPRISATETEVETATAESHLQRLANRHAPELAARRHDQEPAAHAGAAARAQTRAHAQQPGLFAELSLAPGAGAPVDMDDLADTGDPADTGELASVTEVVKELRANTTLTGITIGAVHGRMAADEKQRAMANFASGAAPILVATTVIEVGIDVPQATMMVILDAQRFGLSQLHQLRGRIGRGTEPSLCLAAHRAVAGTIGFERLTAFAATTDGFALAERDLELRNEGDVLGEQQSGRHSSLRFLSVLRDGELIEQAKEAAQALVMRDETLAGEPALRGAVAHLEKSATADYIERT